MPATTTNTTHKITSPPISKPEQADSPKQRSWLGGCWDYLTQSSSISFITSMVIHTLLLIILALIGAGSGLVDSLSLVNMGWTDASDTSAFDLEPVRVPSDLPKADQDQPLEVGNSLEISVDSLDAPPTLDSSLETLPEFETSSVIAEVAASAGSANLGTSFASTSVESRTNVSRQEAVKKRGGSAASEQAVEDALKWMAAHQMVDGGWSCHFNHDACRGLCRNSGSKQDPHRVAATGLALLCYLGAGYTHLDGPYQDAVSRGIYFLRQAMESNRAMGRFPGDTTMFAMYEQGIATLAVCEAYQMTKDPQLLNMVERAIKFIEYAQHEEGGWGYDPRIPGDLSIACWQMMAMKSASGSDVAISGKSLKSFDRFLDSQQSEEGAYYGYRGPVRKPGTTAMGLLMRMYRGWGQTDPRLRKGVSYLANLGPSQNDVYFNYYATQVLFHYEGTYWEPWNLKMRDYLVSTQSKNGHEAGSWYADDRHFNVIGGRLYTTAMCCMTLEVYYRHMPIYETRPDEEFKF